MKYCLLIEELKEQLKFFQLNTNANINSQTDKQILQWEKL